MKIINILEFIAGTVIVIIVIIYGPSILLFLPFKGISFPAHFIAFAYGIAIILSLVLFLLRRKSIFLGLFIGSIIAAIITYIGTALLGPIF